MGPALHSEEGRRAAVERAFLELDEHLSKKDVSYGCGTTCTAAIIWLDALSETDNHQYHVLLANLGDSRSLIVRQGRAAGEEATGILVGETEDHKPDMQNEENRIRE